MRFFDFISHPRSTHPDPIPRWGADAPEPGPDHLRPTDGLLSFPVCLQSDRRQTPGRPPRAHAVLPRPVPRHGLRPSPSRTEFSPAGGRDLQGARAWSNPSSAMRHLGLNSSASGAVALLAPRLVLSPAFGQVKAQREGRGNLAPGQGERDEGLSRSEKVL